MSQSTIPSRTYLYSPPVRRRSNTFLRLRTCPFTETELARRTRRLLRRDVSAERLLKVLERRNRRQPRPWPQWKLHSLVATQDSRAFDDNFGLGNVPLANPTDTTAHLTGEPNHFFKVSNAIFDRRLKMPAEFKLVWLCLQRHANYPDNQRVVRRISQERIGLECSVDRRVVAAAIRFLIAIRAIIQKLKGGTKRKGRRLTSVYHVPKVSAVLTELERRIEELPRHLKLTRPDAMTRVKS
jgi:hypothetical protein